VFFNHLQSEQFTFSCSAIPLDFHVVLAITEPFITPCDEFLCPLCYQPSCHNCWHGGIVCKYVASQGIVSAL